MMYCRTLPRTVLLLYTPSDSVHCTVGLWLKYLHSTAQEINFCALCKNAVNTASIATVLPCAYHTYLQLHGNALPPGHVYNPRWQPFALLNKLNDLNEMTPENGL